MPPNIPKPFLQTQNQNIYTGFEFTNYHILLNSFYDLLQTVIQNQYYSQKTGEKFQLLFNKLNGYYNYLDHISELILQGRKINFITILKMYEEKNLIPQITQNLISEQSQQTRNISVFQSPKHQNQQQSNQQNTNNNYFDYN